MSKSIHHNKQILVYADWIDLGGTILMGTLQAEQVRGKEVFSFSYFPVPSVYVDNSRKTRTEKLFARIKQTLVRCLGPVSI